MPALSLLLVRIMEPMQDVTILLTLNIAVGEKK
jgi:hypothetical protein